MTMNIESDVDMTNDMKICTTRLGLLDTERVQPLCREMYSRYTPYGGP
jgi:hypothetical protein